MKPEVHLRARDVLRQLGVTFDFGFMLMEPWSTIGTVRTNIKLVLADERLKREFPLITLPVLILHGTADKVTKPGGSQLFYDTAGSADKTLKLYEGHARDLLNDIDKEKVMADIQDWVGARLPAM